MAQMGLEAYYNEPEPTNEIIGFHNAAEDVSTNAPSGGRMDPRSVGSESGMSLLTEFAIENPPLNVVGDTDIIPDDGTEENQRRKIRRVIEQPNATLRMIRDSPVFQLMARISPALMQPESEIERWIYAQQQTSNRYHDKQNRDPLMPPIRAPG
eukprot:9859087-Karenia_brevis.AAC.1